MVAITRADLLHDIGKAIGIVYLWHITELLRYHKRIFLLVHISYEALMNCTYMYCLSSSSTLCSGNCYVFNMLCLSYSMCVISVLRSNVFVKSPCFFMTLIYCLVLFFAALLFLSPLP